MRAQIMTGQSQLGVDSFRSWESFFSENGITLRPTKMLVGGLEHEFYDFPFSWEFHHPN